MIHRFTPEPASSDALAANAKNDGIGRACSTRNLLLYVQMSKLTLSVDGGVVSRAKRYAKQRGVSLSEMVEAYLAAVSEPSPRTPKDSHPILRSVRGSLKKADFEGQRKHQAAKYR